MQRGNKTVNFILIVAILAGIFYGWNYFKVDMDYRMFKGKLQEELTPRDLRVQLSSTEKIIEEVIRVSQEYKTISLKRENVQIRDGGGSREKILVIKYSYTYDLPLLKKTRHFVIEREFKRSRD